MMLADKYRPRRFKDVWGQDAVVRQLSGLARARRGSHLLLTGAYGSGKTTLVRIFARALNCEQLTEDGSPCDECPSCSSASDDCLVEYDVPGRGGDKDAIRAWVDVHNRESITTKWKILFLDEAHALKPTAADSLLKDVEEPRAGVLFALATTEPWELKPTLKSRTLPLEVRPLSAPDAVDFLETIARREGIFYDRDALLLLACVKQGHPRDLLNGLGQVAGLGRGVTVETVKSLFAIHDAESLIEYFLALGTGDASAQIAAMGRWRERMSSKIQGVQTLLTSIYYNELLGRKIVIDALLDTLSSERATIVSAFCARFRVNEVSDLIPYWSVMLDFWSRARSTDEEAARLQLCLFEDLVNRRLEHETSEPVSRSLSRAPGAPFRRRSKEPVKTIAGAPATDIEPVGTGDQYLGPLHVRKIVNTASFFVQHHGQTLNAAFTVYPSWRARSSEASAITAINRFREELADAFGLASAPFASITTYERDLGGVLGRVVAHVPALVESPAAEDALLAWCESLQSHDGDGLLVRVEAHQGAPDARAMKLHWNSVFSERFNSFECAEAARNFIEAACGDYRPRHTTVLKNLLSWAEGEADCVKTAATRQALSPTEPLSDQAREVLREALIGRSSDRDGRRSKLLDWMDGLQSGPKRRITWEERPAALDAEHWRDIRSGGHFFSARNAAIQLLDSIEAHLGGQAEQRLKLTESIPDGIRSATIVVRSRAKRFLAEAYDPSPTRYATEFCVECSDADDRAILKKLVERDGRVLQLLGDAIVPGWAFRGWKSPLDEGESDGGEGAVETDHEWPEGISFRVQNMLLLSADLRVKLDHCLAKATAVNNA